MYTLLQEPKDNEVQCEQTKSYILESI